MSRDYRGEPKRSRPNDRYHPSKRHCGRDDNYRSRWPGRPPARPTNSQYYRPNRYSDPTTKNKNYSQIFDFEYSGPSRSSEELTGPGSDSQRKEKVMATKKRIEEALASKPDGNKEINFRNSPTDNIGKSKDKESNCSNLDLSLTNSDFKEIGSVGSVPIEGDVETNDILTNAPSNITVRTSQQRSFESTTSTVPINVQTSQQRPQRVGGWSMSGGSEIVTELNRSCSPKQRNDMFLQEQREEILGSVSTATEKNLNKSTTNIQSNENEDYEMFSRIGRLYHNFLKSRLFGYTLKLKDRSPISNGPNPLLDKSVLAHENSDKNQVSGDQVLELQMPLPIRVKMESNNTEQIAAEEALDAAEFCQDYSYLLKDPNFLIPPGDLEKLGLGHLSELNKLIIDRRIGGAVDNTREQQDSFRIRNFGVSNSVAGSDTAVNINSDPHLFNNLQNICQREIIDRLNEEDRMLNNGNSPSGSRNTPPLDQITRSDVSIRDKSLLIQSPQTTLQSVSVEAVVEKVINRILQPNINAVLNPTVPPTSDSRTNTSKNVNENRPPDPGTSFSETRSSTPNQMQDLSGKVLRLFLLDKKIEELTAEKMKIYSELLSSQGVSQTLFHSWAQDQIQQDKVMSVVSNTSNVIPELGRVITRDFQETNPLQATNALEETISELYSLKKECGGNEDIINSQMEESHSNDVPSDGGFKAPTEVVEEIRPKLSVRKDLLDPNRVNLLNTLDPANLLKTANISPITTENNANPSDGGTDVDKSNAKREKKKKKSKKVEVINLLEDTDDEINSTNGRDSIATDDLSSKGLNSEDEVDKNFIPVANSKMSYELDGKTATCMTVIKMKKLATKYMVVGCKDGFVMGYALDNPSIDFTHQIHKDTITGVYHTNKYLITGSADSTVCLYSLKDRVATQTLSVSAPVQSMDVNLGKLVVGTKGGSIYSYTIKVMNDKKNKGFVCLLPNKKSLSITKSSILAVKLAKEGVREVLIVASRGEQITVRDSSSGLLLRTFDWCDTVYCLQLYEETPLVYCGTNTRSVKVVNYTDGESAGDCKIARSITEIIFLQSLMFASSYDGNIYVFDVEKNSLIATIMCSKGIIQCLGIDSKNHVILVATSRGDLQQIPFPSSVAKHYRKLKLEKKKSQLQGQA